MASGVGDTGAVGTHQEQQQQQQLHTPQPSPLTSGAFRQVPRLFVEEPLTLLGFRRARLGLRKVPMFFVIGLSPAPLFLSRLVSRDFGGI